MAKGNLRLISARIDEDSYKKIESIANRHNYWNKNYIIRKILSVVLNDLNDVDIFDLLRRPSRPICPPKCEYRYLRFEDNSKQ